jgi:preprotein translocase subunit SecA
LTKESRAAGGLAIIGTERHESRRVDRQLRGRSGRQGDPGSSQFFVSLEDNLMRLFGSDRIAKLMDRMGLEEGEVIQHSMITKSIERAQKKVEENNFAIRKRLLEYDDVMNSQREVIYRRRRNALFGDRLQLDIMNMIYDTCEDVVLNTKDAEDYDGFKLNVLGILALDYQISKEDFLKIDFPVLSEQLYEAAYDHYRKKNKAISDKAYPIFQSIQKERGATVDNIMVPFTDRKKQIGVVTNLEQNLNTDCKELIVSMEKMVTLAFIDQAWKEHLREMDDLKQSVQNAVYEQKDPLLIYKFEAFELFKRFIAKVNEDTNTFLMHADLPVQDSNEVQEARAPRTRQRLQESKADSESLLSRRGPDTRNRPPAEKTLPMKSTKVAGRNERVTVQYVDGNVKKDVKFKTVEDDIKNNKCVLLED